MLLRVGQKVYLGQADHLLPVRNTLHHSGLLILRKYFYKTGCTVINIILLFQLVIRLLILHYNVYDTLALYLL
jgi:hypothetical protein